VNVYVYQINDSCYGVGFIEAVCLRRGRIVETWPVDTAEQIDFLELHGSAFKGVYYPIKRMAERARNCMDMDAAQWDEEREAMLLEMAALPFKTRLKAGLRVIFGRYQETQNAAQSDN